MNSASVSGAAVSVLRFRLMALNLRAMALLTAMGGMAALFLVAGSMSARAAEERLHNESSMTYGLLAPSAGSSSRSDNGQGNAGAKSSPASFKSSDVKTPGRGGNEPDLEDPGLPSYDGGGAPGGNGPSNG